MLSRLLLVMTLATVLAAPAKWGGAHKKSQPLIIPDAPFSIDANDPRDAVAYQYLQKKLQQLKDDREEYPGLRVQIKALIDDASALELIPVADPTYAEKFEQFHASLVSLWDMEHEDSI